MSTLTVIALIEQAAEQLDAAQVAYGHGTATAFDEAAWLVLWRLGWPLDSDLDDTSLTISLEQQAQITALSAERSLLDVQSRRVLALNALMKNVAGAY